MSATAPAPRPRGLPAGVRVVFVADAPTAGPGALVEGVAEALDGVPPGSLLVVERDRPPEAGGASDGQRLERLRRLRTLTRERGAPLVVGARADLAAAVGAEGVQLPELGLPPEPVRRAFPALRIGRSCHDRPGLRAAADAGADWAFLSPVRSPGSKPAERPALGVEGFEAMAREAPLPVVALGGVDAELAPALRRAGAAAVAVVGAILDADRPGEAARGLVEGASGPGSELGADGSAGTASGSRAR